MRKRIGSVHLFHLANKTVHHTFSATPVNDGETGRSAEQGRDVHVAGAAHEFDIEIIRLAYFLIPGKGEYGKTAGL